MDDYLTHRQHSAHFFGVVYTEMLLQISMMYPSLGDPMKLTASDIRFYYNGIRGQLKEHTRPKSKG